MSRERVCTAWMPAKPLVDIHPAQQRLIEARLKLVRHEQDLVFVRLESLADVSTTQIRVQRMAVSR